MSIPAWCRWILGLGIAFLVAVVPVVFFRWEYTYEKRLRIVVPGRLYRSGQMTEAGFRQAVHDLGLRTVINVQDDYPDPDIARGFWDRRTTPESELCRRLGVKYVFIPPDLVRRGLVPEERPEAIDQFLSILDNPASYPVLIHCRAGLHRTGCMVAVYRMEYEGWSPRAAINEMKENGFGDWACSSANDYITQYVLKFRRGIRCPHPQGLAETALPAGPTGEAR